jgi:arabinofuranosyltransferase
MLRKIPIGSRSLRLALILPLLLLVVLAAGARAWVCDDAYITFRTIDNFSRGLGLRWNPAERVQAYTHPLWMALMVAARAATGEFFYSSIALSLALSAAALVVFLRGIAGGFDLAGLGLVALLSSRAFLDYSTSGLENPLVHLLLALFLAAWLRPAPATRARTFSLALIASLLATTRLDLLVLLSLPLFEIVRDRPVRRAPAAAALGLLPLAGWEAFSLLYYGFLFPNSAYAKLETGLPRLDLIRHGLEYLANSLCFDPTTLLTTAAGVAAGFRGRDRRDRALAGGIILYLLYIVAIGGDFMSGRFLTAPLLAAVALLARSTIGPRLAWAGGLTLAAGALAMQVSSFAGAAHHRTGVTHPALDAYGIADERAVYEEGASLRRAPAGGPWPNPPSFAQALEIRSDWIQNSWIPELKGFGIVEAEETWPLPAPGPGDPSLRPVIVRGAVGFLGYYLGPDIHVLDYLGLGDPLLSHLPAMPKDPSMAVLYPRLADRPYRIGHFVRKVPAGYFETLVTGRNRIRDPRLAAYYDRIALVTRGPLWDRRRLMAIWKLNTGG